MRKATGSVYGALITVVSSKAMKQAYGFLRAPQDTMALVGLPPGFISIPVFDTVRSSILGTRQDLEEALTFAGEGKVAVTSSGPNSTAVLSVDLAA